MNISPPSPKVSVCVVTYNQENYIRQCLQSVVDQERDFEIEVIVSDDCSTDNTPNIVREFADKYSFIIPILRKKNIGAFKNFVETHNMAKGEYVCHLDGDDCWLNGKLKFQVAFMDKHPDYVQIWHFARRIDDTGKVINTFPSWLAKYLYPSTLTAKDIALSYALVGHHSTQMYRREARDSLEIDNTRPLLDFWFAFHYSLSGKSYYAKRIYSNYRVTTMESITRSKSKKRLTVDLLSEHLVDIVQDHPDLIKHAKANILTRKFFSFFRRHNLDIIHKNSEKITNAPTSVLLILKSSFYFFIQKI